MAFIKKPYAFFLSEFLLRRVVLLNTEIAALPTPTLLPTMPHPSPTPILLLLISVACPVPAARQPTRPAALMHVGGDPGGHNRRHGCCRFSGGRRGGGYGGNWGERPWSVRAAAKGAQNSSTGNNLTISRPLETF